MWVAAAAAIALVAGAIEFLTVRKRPPPVRALHWVLLRVSADAAVGAIAYPITSAAAGGAEGAGVAVAAGLAGPAILRATVVVERPGGKSAAVGPERRYRQLMRAINERISQLGAASDSVWINDVALPAFAGSSPAALVERIEAYYWALDLPAPKVKQQLVVVAGIVNDGSLPDDEKRRRLVGHLIESGHRVFVQTLVKVARRTPLKSAAEV